jgi:hypothetical protein
MTGTPDTESVPAAEWVWCGFAGHFVGARNCRFHLCTRVGRYRVSTVGDYHPSTADGEAPKEIGLGRLYETFVFEVDGHGEHGEGEVVDWSEVDSDGCSDGTEAEHIHMAMCRKWAAQVDATGGAS